MSSSNDTDYNTDCLKILHTIVQHHNIGNAPVTVFFVHAMTIVASLSAWYNRWIYLMYRLHEHQRLDRIEDAYYQYTALKVASWYPDTFPLSYLPLHAATNETLPNMVRVYHRLFMEHYSSKIFLHMYQPCCNYCIAGNFQGRKLSRISQFYLPTDPWKFSPSKVSRYMVATV